jgi:hypothetical protein
MYQILLVFRYPKVEEKKYVCWLALFHDFVAVVEQRKKSSGRNRRAIASQGKRSALLTNWKFVFSPETSDMMGNCIGRCRVLEDGRWIRVEGKRGGDLVCARLTRWNFRPCGDASRARRGAHTKIHMSRTCARDQYIIGGGPQCKLGRVAWVNCFSG